MDQENKLSEIRKIEGALEGIPVILRLIIAFFDNLC